MQRRVALSTLQVAATRPIESLAEKDLQPAAEFASRCSVGTVRSTYVGWVLAVHFPDGPCPCGTASRTRAPARLSPRQWHAEDPGAVNSEGLRGAAGTLDRRSRRLRSGSCTEMSSGVRPPHLSRGREHD